MDFVVTINVLAFGPLPELNYTEGTQFTIVQNGGTPVVTKIEWPV
jgi:hypothetical protein